MKVFNLIFCLLFVISAVLQYNDPDPYIWIPIYMYGAVLCWLAFRNKFYPKAYLVGIIVYLVYAIGLFFWKNGVARSSGFSLQASAPTWQLRFEALLFRA